MTEGYSSINKKHNIVVVDSFGVNELEVTDETTKDNNNANYITNATISNSLFTPLINNVEERNNVSINNIEYESNPIQMDNDVNTKCTFSCSNIASTLFHDQRKSIFALYAWLAILIGLFVNIGIGDSDFIHFGPSVNAKFMSITIDTWSKWTIIAVFQFCNTFINIFVAESMFPWIQNTIQDHKNKYLPYSKATCMWICQTYYLYGNIVSMFGLFAMFVQVDFLIIRTVADILVSYYTTSEFLKTKEHNVVEYNKWFKSDPSSEQDKKENGDLNEKDGSAENSVV